MESNIRATESQWSLARNVYKHLGTEIGPTRLTEDKHRALGYEKVEGKTCHPNLYNALRSNPLFEVVDGARPLAYKLRPNVLSQLIDEARKEDAALIEPSLEDQSTMVDRELSSIDERERVLWQEAEVLSGKRKKLLEQKAEIQRKIEARLSEKIDQIRELIKDVPWERIEELLEERRKNGRVEVNGDALRTN